MISNNFKNLSIVQLGALIEGAARRGYGELAYEAQVELGRRNLEEKDRDKQKKRKPNDTFALTVQMVAARPRYHSVVGDSGAVGGGSRKCVEDTGYSSWV